MTLRPALVLSLVVLGATAAVHPAHAEIDAGESYFHTKFMALGGVTASPGPSGTMVETWTIDPIYYDARASRDIVLDFGPRQRGATNRGARCDKLSTFTVNVAYEAVADLAEVADEARAGARSERVLIDGDTVGWRVLWLEAGAYQEVWVLTAEYAPPLPSRQTAPDAAYANGWLRPYADNVQLVSADGEQVAEELENYSDSEDADTGRVARTAFVPRPATAEEARRVCRATR